MNAAHYRWEDFRDMWKVIAACELIHHNTGESRACIGRDVMSFLSSLEQDGVKPVGKWPR